MTVSFYKRLRDRVLFYVPKSEHNSAFANNAAYANDGRSLRFLDYSIQPSGEFAVFEGSLGSENRVKRIEQDPILVTEMFGYYFDEAAPVGLSAYSASPLRFTDVSKIYREFQAGLDEKNLARQARALQLILLKRKAQAPVTGLPEEVISANPPSPAKVEGKPEQSPTPDGEKSKFPWGWAALGLIGLVLIASSNSKEG